MMEPCTPEIKLFYDSRPMAAARVWNSLK